VAYLPQGIDAGYYPYPTITGNNEVLTDGLTVCPNAVIVLTNTANVVIATFLAVPQLVITAGFPDRLIRTFGKPRGAPVYPIMQCSEWGTPGNTQPTSGEIPQDRVPTGALNRYPPVEDSVNRLMPPTLVT
jgi:hypothetical protein